MADLVDADGGTLSGDEWNRFFEGSFNKIIGHWSTKMTDTHATLTYTSTRWQNATRLTTDGGATSSALATGCTSAVICKQNRVKAIGYTGTTIRFTANSGATWANASTNPPNISTVTSIDFDIEGRAYISGTTAATMGLWYSIDGGDNWTQVGTPASGAFTGVKMHDSTHGLAINTSGGIFYSTNGTTWTDTTHLNVLPNNVTNTEILVLTSGANVSDFSALISARGSSMGETGFVGKYDGTAQAIPNLGIIGRPLKEVSNILKLTNGNIIYAVKNRELGSGYWGPMGITLYMTQDEGVTWYSKFVGILAGYQTSSEKFPWTKIGDVLMEYDTNKVLIYDEYRCFTFDYSFI